jgi:hypothetical protein
MKPRDYIHVKEYEVSSRLTVTVLQTSEFLFVFFLFNVRCVARVKYKMITGNILVVLIYTMIKI